MRELRCPDAERWVIDFEGFDVSELLSDEEPLLSAARDTREPEEDRDE
jgi:hypothetical protein